MFGLNDPSLHPKAPSNEVIISGSKALMGSLCFVPVSENECINTQILTYCSLPRCSLVGWSESEDGLVGRTLSDGQFPFTLHKFSRERDRLVTATSFTLPPALLLLLLLWTFPATALFPTGS